MTKNQLISNIQQINRSARRDWLEGFDTQALRHYLDHLQKSVEPRGRKSVWRRTGTARAISTRRPALF